MSNSPTVGFVCVRNAEAVKPLRALARSAREDAGRSQMATALAERESEARDLDIGIVTGGTRPAEPLHENVVETLRERGIEIERRVAAFVDQLERDRR